MTPDLPSLCRTHHLALRTQQAYISWIKRFQRSGLPETAKGATQWLSDMAQRRCSPATQKQAFNALRFYFKANKKPAPDWDAIPKAKQKRGQIIRYLSRNEVSAILDQMGPPYAIMAKLIYGTGMRLMECIRLRVKDLDFEALQLSVVGGKGNKSRIAPLPLSLAPLLKARVKMLRDREQYLWPSLICGINGQRQHICGNSLQKEFAKAVVASGINKPASLHWLRHSCITEWLRQGNDIRTVQDMAGHSHISTTQRYLHAMAINGNRVRSPADDL